MPQILWYCVLSSWYYSPVCPQEPHWQLMRTEWELEELIEPEVDISGHRLLSLYSALSVTCKCILEPSDGLIYEEGCGRSNHWYQGNSYQLFLYSAVRRYLYFKKLLSGTGIFAYRWLWVL